MKSHIANILKYKDLILQLSANQIILKYRRSYLGFLWSLLNPLLMMFVLTVVFSTLFQNRIENFPVYLVAGRLIFEFNSECTKAALNSMVSNSALIKKVYVPKYVFPFSDALASLVNLLFSLIALVIVMLFTRAPIHWTILLFWLPIVYVFIFSTGLGLILCTANVFFRDFKHLYTVLLTMWMYLTPLFYPVDILPAAALPSVRANPIYQYVSMFRGLVMYGELPTIQKQIVCLCSSLEMLIKFFFLLKTKQYKFILYI